MRLEEYKTFLDHVDNITDRRPGITTTYIGVNTAIVSVITLILADSKLTEMGQQLATLGLLICGIVSCILWRKLISQYKVILEWWYLQLHLLEEQIPECSRLITKEYQELYIDIKRKPVIGITRFEVYLTWLFNVLYITLTIFVLFLLLV